METQLVGGGVSFDKEISIVIDLLTSQKKKLQVAV